MEKQKMIVAATMCLHNYIRETNVVDRDFHKCDRNPDYIPTIPSRYARHSNPSDTWIDFGMTLQEQFSFLDHHDHVV